jgi:hypothetical protein
MQKPSISCIGKIKILHRTGKSIYAGWEMHIEDGTSLAGVSRNYFMNKENASEEEVIPFILDNIMNYRIGRERVFTEVQVINE